MRRPRLLLVLVGPALVGLALACSDDSGGGGGQDAGQVLDRGAADSVVDGFDGSPRPDAGPPPSYCNPLISLHCMLPWPSSFYLAKDSTTQTGYRVAYPQKAMPRSADRMLIGGVKDPGKHVDPARYNLLDGFPVGSQAVVQFEKGVGSAGLPDAAAIGDSVKASSLIWVVEADTGARVPLFAEVDANAEADENAVLIIRPMKPLKFNTRYVVVIRKGLKDAKGSALEPPAPFRKVRDGASITDATLKAEATRLGPVLALLDTWNLKRSEVLLAWDFHTASQQALQGNVQGMLKEARAIYDGKGPAVSDVKVKDLTSGDADFGETLREIEGNMAVPSFLKTDDASSWLQLDASGKPKYRGLQKFGFYAQVPRCAATATAPLPVLIFGHGLFGQLKGEMQSSWFRKMQNDLCMVTAETTWTGLSLDDLAYITSQIISEDFSNLPFITDRLQQAQVKADALVELMRGDFLKHAAMTVGGKPVTDGKSLYYLGISNGGIQGVAFAANNRRIQRFVFNVSGGLWSLMIQRSSNFDTLAFMMKLRYPSAADRSLLVSLSQHVWEHTDPVTWAGNVVSAPLSGTTANKRVLLQESLYDDQVPNLATRAVARGLGLDALSPVVASVAGVPAKAAPLSSALMQFDMKPKVKPSGKNIPAPKPQPDESAHFNVRKSKAFLAQIKAFLKPNGQVIHPCTGPCDPD